MNNRPSSRHRQSLPILNFVAWFDVKTVSSISFILGRYSDTIQASDGKPICVGPKGGFQSFGWADIHHPCLDHIKARIRARLSDDLMEYAILSKIINTIFDALSIPRDETYEAFFFSSNSEMRIEQPVDRNGMTDRT